MSTMMDGNMKYRPVVTPLPDPAAGVTKRPWGETHCKEEHAQTSYPIGLLRDKAMRVRKARAPGPTLVHPDGPWTGSVSTSPHPFTVLEEKFFREISSIGALVPRSVRFRRWMGHLLGVVIGRLMKWRHTCES